MNTDINTPTPEPLLHLADADCARLTTLGSVSM
jgi:hypothetical protein